MAAQKKTGAQPVDGKGSSNEQLPIDHGPNHQVSEKQDSHNNGSDSRDYIPPPSSFSMPKQNGSSDRGANGLADFFSQEVFQIVLHNPTTAHRLLKFSQARMCGENMEFLEKVDRYNALLDELTTVMTEIHQSYTSNEAPKQLSVNVNILKRINGEIKQATTSTLPSMESVFTEAQTETEALLRTAIYPRFVKYQMTNSASKALSTDREKYQGLGDCFCLTDPNKADNPISFASDGFVSVTGYTRPEIIPRNCRFLQGNYTDRTATRRLKASIEAKEETVELLLNYRKNGEPFWNLLYVAPLYDVTGKVVFFIGGQINCSTTIRSNTDVLRILSMSDEPEDDGEAVTSIPGQKPARRRLFGFARKESTPRLPQSTKNVEVRDTGMEPALLKQIEKLNFRSQMEQFYTAYSKYIVIKYDSLSIQHYSHGIVELLGISNRTSHDFVGNNIFKFLTQHTATLPREFKSKVQYALKHGQAISASINLFTLRSLARRSDDKFFTHWTPTKDEHGRVKYVVVTLSSTLYD
ncbi:MAG: hypothetical protein Q9217_003953 [Psora testacea]